MIDIYTELETQLGAKARRSEPLADHTTFRIGGPADLLCLPETLDDVLRIVQWVTARSIPWIALGNGSNMLFSDAGFRGVVIKIQGHGLVSGTLWDIQQEDVRIWAGAGISLARLAWFCASVGLSGVEFATGIPGVVGGSIRGNAGAHGASLGDRVEAVNVMVPSGEILTLSAHDVGFTYRHTRLSPSVLITRASFILTPDDPQTIRERIREYTEYRKRTQPSADQSAGCIFKNPSGNSAGRLIDLAGCKGLQVGDAVVSHRHANFIINRGHATADDTLRLIDRIRALVSERTGVRLDLEVRVIGQDAA